MSDVSQGPGWWQASDGKWYPPEAAPTAAPTGPPSFASAQPGFAPGGAAAPGGGSYASWGTRVAAYLIDVVLLIPLYIIYGVLVNTGVGILVLIGFLVFLVAIAAAFYFVYLTGETGQSPGKRIMGIKVVSEQTGQPIGGGMGIVRQIAHVVDGICMIGYLFPLWDAKRQTLADKILTTVVLDGQPKQSFGPDLFKP